MKARYQKLLDHLRIEGVDGRGDRRGCIPERRFLRYSITQTSLSRLSLNYSLLSHTLYNNLDYFLKPFNVAFVVEAR
jgi:hypothetical protein